MNILSFYDQDQIFNEIYSKEIDNLLLNGEESLRGTEATTDYILKKYTHI